MNRLSLGAFVLVALFAAGPAVAGPNAGGTLVVHDVGIDLSCDSTNPPPTSCATVDNQLTVSAPGPCYSYWKVYAAFPECSSPRLSGLAMGATFGPSVHMLAAGMINAGDFEITTGGWPLTSGGGIAMSFPSSGTQTTHMTEVYWFAGYSTAVDAWSLVPHPLQATVFVDDATPKNFDPITGLGSIGFGVPGSTPCPAACGACCLATGECVTLAEPTCVSQSGRFIGGACEASTCSPVPTVQTRWGRIKANYR